MIIKLPTMTRTFRWRKPDMSDFKPTAVCYSCKSLISCEEGSLSCKDNEKKGPHRRDSCFNYTNKAGYVTDRDVTYVETSN